MRPIRFDPFFAALTLIVTIYVVLMRGGGDPTIVTLGYLVITASAVMLDLLVRLYRWRRPSSRGVRAR